MKSAVECRVLIVIAVYLYSQVVAGEPYQATDGTFNGKRFSFGPLPECVDLFNVLSAGQLFNCNQTKTTGRASVSVAGNTLAVSVYDSDGAAPDWICWNKRGTKSTPVFGLIPDDAGDGVSAQNAPLVTKGVSALCFTLELAVTADPTTTPPPVPLPNAMPYTNTYGNAWPQRRGSITTDVTQCRGLFAYLQAHQVMTCQRGETRAYFSVSNTTLSVTVAREGGVDLDCTNLRGGNQCVLPSQVVRNVARGAYDSDLSLFRSGLAAACVILDPDLRTATLHR